MCIESYLTNQFDVTQSLLYNLAKKLGHFDQVGQYDQVGQLDQVSHFDQLETQVDKKTALTSPNR